MECLDANVVQDLMAGALEPPARVLAIEHLDECQECRDLIALLARDATHEVVQDSLGDTEKRGPSIERRRRSRPRVSRSPGWCRGGR